VYTARGFAPCAALDALRGGCEDAMSVDTMLRLRGGGEDALSVDGSAPHASFALACRAVVAATIASSGAMAVETMVGNEPTPEADDVDDDDEHETPSSSLWSSSLLGATTLAKATAPLARSSAVLRPMATVAFAFALARLTPASASLTAASAHWNSASDTSSSAIAAASAAASSASACDAASAAAVIFEVGTFEARRGERVADDGAAAGGRALRACAGALSGSASASAAATSANAWRCDAAAAPFEVIAFGACRGGSVTDVGAGAGE